MTKEEHLKKQISATWDTIINLEKAIADMEHELRKARREQ